MKLIILYLSLLILIYSFHSLPINPSFPVVIVYIKLIILPCVNE